MGFILAATGSAVGLGNIWKFPYMVGESGGAAFVLVYLLCIGLVGAPILIAEWMLGRRGHKNPVNTMAQLARDHQRHPAWVLVGASGVLAAFLILSFYSVIGGWTLAYLADTVTGQLTRLTPDTVGQRFGELLADPLALVIWHTVFMLLTIGIVARGVTQGLERGSKILMPALFAIVLALVAYAATTPGFGQGVRYLFQPDWSQFNDEVLLAALGHAFFTLSLGMGIMMSYGSYLGEDISLLQAARTVILLDTTIALCAGLAIFPIVFSHGLDAEAGPSLVFVTLPLVFSQIDGGQIVGGLFFLLLAFAALTSAMSLLEPVVETLEERSPLSRTAATVVAGVAIWALGLAALLSFNRWSDVTLGGLNLFDGLDYLTSKFMLPLAGLGAIVFAAWKLPQDMVRRELGLSPRAFWFWQGLARVVAPLGVLYVFVTQLL